VWMSGQLFFRMGSCERVCIWHWTVYAF